MSRFTLDDDLKKQNHFKVPENYFENFEVRKKFRLTNEFKQNSWVVPANYFETFEVRKQFALTDEYKQNPFAVPENYFATFEVNPSAVLETEEKQIPFTVPNNYFESLSERISERIAGTTARPAVAQWRSLRAQLAYAASFVLMICVGLGLFMTSEQSAKPITVAATSPIEFAEIITDELYRIDEQTLLQAAASAAVDNRKGNNVADEIILQYLANANISVNDIVSLY